MNLVKKVWLQRQNETLPTDKYLTINQPQQVKNRGKSTTKIPEEHNNKKSIQKTPRNNLSKTKQQKTTATSKQGK